MTQVPVSPASVKNLFDDLDDLPIVRPRANCSDGFARLSTHVLRSVDAGDGIGRISTLIRPSVCVTTVE